MIVIYIILGIIAFILLLGLFISKDMNYEKSISISASASDVWKNVCSLEAMDNWSPWSEKDPNMNKTWEGSTGEVGSKQSWVSDNKEVGEGSQTITKLDGPHRIDTHLEFIKPFKSEAEAYVILKDNNGTTTATWGFESTMPYPMNLMKLFMNFEKGMDKSFGMGLNKLKEISEE